MALPSTSLIIRDLLNCVETGEPPSASLLTDAKNYLAEFEPEDPLRHPDGSLHQFMLTVAGGHFRCEECGCNVFHKPFRTKPNKYECNSCGERYTGQ